MSLRPTELTITDGERLRIVWSDGSIREYSFRQLRDSCPCATCREQRRNGSQNASPLQVLSPEELTPLRIHEMHPMGNYAYNIHFSDGHNTGIFQLSLLLELGQLVS